MFAALQELEAERSELLREESRLQAEIAAQESARNAAERESKRLLQGENRAATIRRPILNAQIAGLQADVQKLTLQLEAGTGGKRHVG